MQTIMQTSLTRKSLHHLFFSILSTSLIPTLALTSCDNTDENDAEDFTPEMEAEYREASNNPEFVFQSPLQKGLGGTNGQSDYCRNPSNKCTVGEGNCSRNSECDTGLICAQDLGARFGLAPAIDVCVPAHCTNTVLDAGDGETDIDCGGDCGSCTRPPSFKNGGSLYCSKPFPCEEGEGSCSGATRPCDAGLTCGTDNGGLFGLSASADVCVDTLCSNSVQDPGEDGVDCGGTCPAACSRPPGLTNGSSTYCSSSFPCDVGEGSCGGTSKPCLPGLVCATDNGARFGLKPAVDACVPAHCTNNVQDAGDGETGIDCGGDCGSCTRPPEFNNGGSYFCSKPFPCNAGQGACSGTNQPCASGTTCTVDAGGAYGLNALADVCVCDAENDAQFCDRVGAECGSITATDLCGATRTVTNCGTCAGEATCSSNTCGCAGGDTLCGDSCIDTDTDPANCGACDNECTSVDGTCSGGNCLAVTQITTGTDHACALMNNGTVRCWGYNSNGQIGDGTTDTRLSPVVVPSLSGVTQIAAGTFHTCALLSNQTVRCWGFNNAGQIGDGTTGTDRTTPTAVSGLTGVIALGMGSTHSCAILSDNTVRCWGSNSQGQLGNNSTTASNTPVTVSSIATATAVTGGGNHTCAILADETVMCWGLNGSGQLGNNSTTRSLVPVAVSSLTGADEIGLGTNFSCARTGGTIKCWGANGSGQLGDGTQGTNRLTPVDVLTITDATSIGTGSSHTCATLSDNTAMCWGFAFSGQIGDGTTGDGSFRRVNPTVVSGVTDATDIQGGGAFTCAETTSGDAKCWGIALLGEVGDGTTGDVNNRRLNAVDVAW